MRAVITALTENRLNLLVVAAPASWVLCGWLPGSAWVVRPAAISLIPLAGLIGLGTEELAQRSGPAVGGFLNATFGNAAELMIAVVALREGHVGLVKASITGSIVGNLLLVLGLSFFVGGLRRRSQRFHRTAATNTAAMLFLAVVALVMPAVFDLSRTAACKRTRRARSPEPVERNRAHVGLRRQPDLRAHGTARSVSPGQNQRRRTSPHGRSRRRRWWSGRS